jgi:hypothetical protein
MHIDILTEKDEQEYSDYVLSREHTSVYASLFFRNLLLNITQPSQTLYIIARKYKDSKIVGVLPTIVKKGCHGAVLNSLPWYGSNPGIIADDYAVAIELLTSFDKIAQWLECFSATIITDPWGGFIDMADLVLKKSDNVFTSHRMSTITELPMYTNREDFVVALLDKFHQKTRNQVRKSFRECYNGKCIPGQMVGDTSVFSFLIEQHQKNMKAIGAPYKDIEFGAFSNLIVGKECELYLARQKETGKPVAALFLLYYNKTVEYFIPAIDAEYRHLDPQHLLIFSAMEEAAIKGYKYWNWGGTAIEGMDGVLRFKTRFGGFNNVYKYYTKIYKPIPENLTADDLKFLYPFFFVLPYKLLGGKDNGTGNQRSKEISEETFAK